MKTRIPKRLKKIIRNTALGFAGFITTLCVCIFIVGRLLILALGFDDLSVNLKMGILIVLGILPIILILIPLIYLKRRKQWALLIGAILALLTIYGVGFFMYSYLNKHVPTMEEISRQKAYINPKILKTESKTIMPGLPPEKYEADYIEKSFKEGVWYPDPGTEVSSYKSYQEVAKQLKRIPSLRLGQRTKDGIRKAVYTIESPNKDIFLVQVGIEEFTKPSDDGYPFGVPFTLADDYICDIAKLTCTQTDIIKRADTHMDASDIRSRTGLVYFFWHFWDPDNDRMIGYKTGEGAFPDEVYLYHPSTNQHTQTNITDLKTFTLSPSRERLLVLHDRNKITTYDIKRDFVPIQDTNFAKLNRFFQKPYDTYPFALEDSKPQWSQDESVVYFVQDERIFAHYISTGITERIIDATVLHNLPQAHADKIISSDKIQSFPPELSRSGRYLHYTLYPYDQSQKNIHIIIDLLDKNKTKEFTEDKKTD